MARVTHDGLQGSIGKYTFYTVNGVNYLRAKPGKRVKKRGQPQNPVVSIFSTVSGYGSAMARHISRNFLFPFGRDTYNSLRGWMWKQYTPNHKESVWGLSTAFDFCQLNAQAGLGDFLKATITVSDRGKQGILLSLPAIDPARQMKLPTRTVEVNIKCIAISKNFSTIGGIPGFCISENNFNYKKGSLLDAQDIILDTKGKKGDIALVILAMEFKTSGEIMYNRDPKWLPAAVVAMGRLKG